MVKRLTMILVGLFLLMGTALAQTSAKGSITSAEDGEPVIGASIKVVGTTILVRLATLMDDSHSLFLTRILVWRFRISV